MAYKPTQPQSLQPTEIDMEAINSYRMPKASPGMQVMWYRNGTRDRTRSEVAYMLHSGERTATIHAIISGRRVEVVRHVDDPKLQLNQDQRENGAWDFTDDYKEAEKARQEIRERLTIMERQISNLITSGAKIPDKPKQTCRISDATASNLERFRELKKKAAEMGIPVSINTTKAGLEIAIASHEQAQANQEAASAAS